MSAPDEPEQDRPPSDAGDDSSEPPADDTGRAAKAAALLGCVLALGALGTHGARAAASVLVGAAIAVANLLTMRAIIRALIQPPAEPDDAATGKGKDERTNHERTGRRGGAAWGIFAAFKILLLFGGVWILLTRELVDPMPLVIGYGVLPLGIAASALWSSLAASRAARR
ncbi:MAG: ATP synthase subunit I [Labilithrix sp.]|nr:ATP synthase subunit I [Labilithrix sp.]MBX3221878.1 ATP synthase subunit I [Labilithrix sp.]